MSDRDDLLDIKETAAFLNVSETSLRRWTNEGLLPCLRIGGRRERRFRRSDLLAFMDVQTARATTSKRSAAAVRSARGTGRGAHLCMMYSTEEGRTRLAVAFLVGGLREGSLCYLVAERPVRERVLARLQRDHLDLQTAIEEGRIIVSEYATSAALQLAYFAAQFHTARRHGEVSLRVVGDAASLAANIGLDDLLEYEAKYERLAGEFGVTSGCQYNVRRCSGVELLAVLRSHSATLSRPAEALLD